jgi:hypothetical protein
MITHTVLSVNKIQSKKTVSLAKPAKAETFLFETSINYWMNNPRLFFGFWRNKGLSRVTNYLAGLSNMHASVYPTQSTIAKSVGMTREHVNVLIDQMVRLGIVTRIHRAYTSCVYILSSYFNDLEFRKSLEKIMPALWYLPLILLQAPEPVNKRNLTLYIKNKYIYKNIITILERSEYAIEHTFIDRTGKKRIWLLRKDHNQLLMERVAMMQVNPVPEKPDYIPTAHKNTPKTHVYTKTQRSIPSQPKTLNHVPNIDAIQEANPDIKFYGHKFLRNNQIELGNYPVLPEFRPMTQEEQDWERDSIMPATIRGWALAGLGEVPIQKFTHKPEGLFKIPETTIYNIGPDNKLAKVRSDRPYTEQEEQLMSWFREYYKERIKNNLTIPAWYYSLVMSIHSRCKDLGSILQANKSALEAQTTSR